MAAIDISIQEELAHLTFKNGAFTKKKTVKTGDLINSISDIAGFSSPILPPGTRFFKMNKANIILGLEIPPMVRKINYGTREKLIFKDVNFPFPYELMFLTLCEIENNQYQMQQGSIFALKGPIFTNQEVLYKFPTTNVSNTGGGICWGSSLSRFGLTKIDNLSQAYKYVSLFHDATFNNDLGVDYVTNESFEKVIRRLKDQPTFDYSILKKEGTIQSVLDRYN